MKQQLKKTVLGKIYITILLIVFGFIVLQGPISVGFGTLWPNYDLLIKSWKEILMLVASVLAIVLLHQKKRFDLLRDPIMILMEVYAGLHLVSIAFMHVSLKSSLAGLAIDLRYVLFFGLVYIALNLYPNYRKIFIKIGVAGALIVLIFALLQVFILPADILKYIGYNVNTISPYLTVDQNHDFIRINSTLRGPNPLGAYAGMTLTLIAAAIAQHKIKKEKLLLAIVAILSAGGIVALWASYSRSALIGTTLAILIVLAVTIVPKMSRKTIMISTAAIALAVLMGVIFIANNSQFASNIFLHENPNGGSSVNSNEGHISSLKSGFDQLIHQPLGAGVGSTGSASLYTNSPLIIENQYLFTAHEVGWLGLALFLLIYMVIMIRLWRLKSDWLALGVFASGICLAIIGLLLPVWVDDTISIVWWGFAAIAYGRCSFKKIC